MNALDLVIIVPELVASQEIVQRLEEIGGHAEIVVDRRRGERRHPGSTTSADRRRSDRRTLDMSESLQAAGWARIPADQRPPEA